MNAVTILRRRLAALFSKRFAVEALAVSVAVCSVTLTLVFMSRQALLAWFVALSDSVMEFARK